MDAPAFSGGFDGLGRGIDVFRDAAREARDHGPVDLGGDLPDGLEIAVADDREPGLDDIGAEPFELPRDLHLLADVHAGARALLPVAQRGVEYSDRIAHISLSIHRAKKQKAPRPPGPRGSLKSALGRFRTPTPACR